MSGITFTQLAPGTELDSAGHGLLTLVGYGNELTLQELGAIGRGILVLEQGREEAGDGVEDPNYGVGSGILYLNSVGYGAGVYPTATGDALLYLDGHGYQTANFGRGSLTLIGVATAFDGGSVPTPPSGGEWMVMYDTLSLNDNIADLPYLVLRSKARLADHTVTKAQAHAKLSSKLALHDELWLVYSLLLTDAVVVGDTLVVDYTPLIALHDTLLLSGTVTTSAEAWIRIEQAVAFGTALEAIELLAFENAVSLSDAAAMYATAAAKMIDTVLLSDDLIGTAVFMMVFEDHLGLSNSITTAAEALAKMHDAIGFSINFSIDDGHYSAWSMNVDSRASTKYDRYPFNSFMRVGDKHYGVSDAGVYRLEGDDDAGQPIKAHLRLGMSSLGSRLKKHVPSVYFGYSAQGDLLIKAIVADSADGTREAHVYRLYANDSAGSQREARTQMGRGLEAVYWDFQIENVDGADFGIDTIEFMPLQVNRRLRGNAGGKR